MRVFVCTMLPPALQERCASVIAVLGPASGGRLRPVPAASAHLTYAFIGALPDDGLDDLVAVMQESARRHGSLAVRLGPPAILHAGAEARLVHLPTERGHEALAALAATVRDAARRALPEVDVAITPAPHVTVARFRRGTRRRDAAPVADAIAGNLADLHLEIVVETIDVVESLLGPSGPRYVTRATARLGPG